MKKASLFILSLLLIAGCTTGAWFEDMAPSAIGSDVEDGATDVDPNTASFSVTFVKDVDVSTVTTSTFFLVEVGAVSSISKGAFDSSVCDSSKAIHGTVSCVSATECSFTPSSPLDSGTEYALCLTSDIKYEDYGNPYPGLTITFTTAEAKGEVVPTEYTIGGTVTGLSGGDTLVLQNNSADDLTVNTNGSFVFSTAVADGGGYAVTVLTKPAAKTCTVSNGTGTVSGANVTNVTVVCSANAYTVGGTVSGLTGTVVLQNNSSDDLSISANGSFTFATAVADGGGYAVTVLTKPANRTCTVSNGTGTVSGANVTNVSVVCVESGLVQWAKSVTVGALYSLFTGVSVDTSGNIYAVGSIEGTDDYTFAAGVTVNGTYGSRNVVIVKYNSSGTAQWAKSVTKGADISYFYGVSVDDTSGDIYAVGHITGDGDYNFGSGVINGTHAVGPNVVIVKYDTGGTAQWAKTVEGASRSEFLGVSVDTSGNVYAVGSINGTGDYDFGSGVINGTAGTNVVIVKYDSNGTAQWAKTVVVTEGVGGSGFTGVSVDTSGDIYAVGHIYGTAGDYDFGGSSDVINGTASGHNAVIVKYDPDDGTAQWAKTVEAGASDSDFFGVSVDTSGNIYAAGNIDANVVIVKYDPDDGTAQWAKTVEAGSESYFIGVSVDTSGNIYAVGYINGLGEYDFGGSSDVIKGTYDGDNVVVVKYDPDDGTAQWAKTVEAGGGDSYFNGVSVDDTSGNIYAVGYINGTEAYNFGNEVVINGTYDGGNVVIVKYTK